MVSDDAVLELARFDEERTDMEMDSTVDKDVGVDVSIGVELAAELETKLVVPVVDPLIMGVVVESSEDGNGAEKAELRLEDDVNVETVLDGVVKTSEPVELGAATDGTAGALELLDIGKLDRPVGEAEEGGMDDSVRIDENDGDCIGTVDERRLEDALDELSLQRPNAD